MHSFLSDYPGFYITHVRNHVAQPKKNKILKIPTKSAQQTATTFLPSIYKGVKKLSLSYLQNQVFVVDWFFPIFRVYMLPAKSRDIATHLEWHDVIRGFIFFAKFGKFFSICKGSLFFPSLSPFFLYTQ